jgi:D-3-phosphoglycerate dehydrogenase
MKIVITDFINIAPEDREKLEKFPDITIYDDTINDPKILSERLRDAEIATANFIDLTGDIITSAPKLKYIISPAKGYDWIDVKKATEKGIKVLNCPTFNSQAVAEHAIGLMFAVERKIVQAHNSILKGEFKPQQFLGTELKGKLLVTIGYGNVGKRVVEMAKGLGMNTKFANTKSSAEELDKIISEADVVVLCLPLNDNTKGLIDKRRISLMKKTSILINVARGLLVDQDALYEVLKSGRIAGAGIDTFAKDETITEAREDIMNFTKLPNVVATPHTAYNTVEAANRLGKELIADIDSCIKRGPINVVN